MDQIEPDRPTSVEVDSAAIVLGELERLRRVVENLVSNARKHTPETAWVGASVAVEDDRVVVRISDRG